jgi:hypothetical protein
MLAAFALVAALGPGGCLAILGDFDTTGSDPARPDGGSASVVNPSIPCWRRSDGWCTCAATAPNDDYVAADHCESTSSGAVAGKCCAFDGWPATGTCTCGVFRCLTLTSNEYSCVCGAYAAPTPGDGFEEAYVCIHASGETCCRAPGRCSCGNPCDAEEEETDSCSTTEFAASVPCGDGGAAVTSCR